MTFIDANTFFNQLLHFTHLLQRIKSMLKRSGKLFKWFWSFVAEKQRKTTLKLRTGVYTKIFFIFHICYKTKTVWEKLSKFNKCKQGETYRQFSSYVKASGTWLLSCYWIEDSLCNTATHTRQRFVSIQQTIKVV